MQEGQKQRRVKIMHNKLLKGSYTEKKEAAEFFGELGDKSYINDLFDVAETCPDFVSKVAIKSILTLGTNDEINERIKKIEADLEILSSRKATRTMESEKRRAPMKLDLEGGRALVCRKCRVKKSSHEDLSYYLFRIKEFEIDIHEESAAYRAHKKKLYEPDLIQGTFQICKDCLSGNVDLEKEIGINLKSVFETVNKTSEGNPLFDSSYYESYKFEVEDIREANYEEIRDKKSQIDRDLFNFFYNNNKLKRS